MVTVSAFCAPNCLNQAFTLFENWTVKVNACNSDVSLVKRLLLLRMIRTRIKEPIRIISGFRLTRTVGVD